MVFCSVVFRTATRVLLTRDVDVDVDVHAVEGASHVVLRASALYVLASCGEGISSAPPIRYLLSALCLLLSGMCLRYSSYPRNTLVVPWTWDLGLGTSE